MRIVLRFTSFDSSKCIYWGLNGDCDCARQWIFEFGSIETHTIASKGATGENGKITIYAPNEMTISISLVADAIRNKNCHYFLSIPNYSPFCSAEVI